MIADEAGKDGWRLGNVSMDDTHEEFLGLLYLAINASAADLRRCLDRLINHTEQHFETELQWMHTSRFPALTEHRDEHLRILGELHHHQQRVWHGKTSMARAYLRERLPEWFGIHLASMDSALAHHLRNFVAEDPS